MPRGVKSDLNESWQTNLDRWQYQCEYLAAIREFEARIGTELDAIITPASPMASAKHGQFKYAGYTSIVNLLDLTSVIVPVTFADKNVDVAKQDFQPAGDLDAEIQKDCKSAGLISQRLYANRNQTMPKIIMEPRCRFRSLESASLKRRPWSLQRRSDGCWVTKLLRNSLARMRTQ